MCLILSLDIENNANRATTAFPKLSIKPIYHFPNVAQASTFSFELQNILQYEIRAETTLNTPQPPANISPYTPTSKMATTASQPQTLTFPRETFAKLSPHAYLLAHLQSPTSTRASGRAPAQPRQAHIHTGSLTHANGSAVVRLGDTTVVCGVRAEILRAEDAAGYRSSNANDARSEAQALDLLVPNVELATGCSPEFLPGAPPSKKAQDLVSSVYGLLHASNVICSEDLRIWGPKPADGDEVPEEGDMEEDKEEELEIKGFWTLYIDILFISLDGNPFDAAWAAVIAALRDVKLPKAGWDIDNARIVCDDEISSAKKLSLNGLPVAVTAAVFGSKERGVNRGSSWILADPDAFEEELCDETVAVLVDCSKKETKLLGIQKVGGTVVGRKEMKELVKMAEERWSTWEGLMKG